MTDLEKDKLIVMLRGALEDACIELEEVEIGELDRPVKKRSYHGGCIKIIKAALSKTPLDGKVLVDGEVLKALNHLAARFKSAYVPGEHADILVWLESEAAFRGKGE